jgi:hypothetical protein
MRITCTSLRIPLALALLGVALLPGEVVRASEARDEALGSALVTDDTDIVDYPGMLTAYSDIVFLNLRPSIEGLGGEAEVEQLDGSLGAAFGREVALGAWVHRRSRWRDLDDTDELFDLEQPLPATHELLDLFLGHKSGFGFRLSFAAGLDSDEEYDDDGEVVSSGGTTFATDLQLGYSFDADGYHGDLGAGLTFNYFEIVRAGQRLYASQTAPSFLFRHRSIFGPRRDLSGVVDVLLTRRAYTVQNGFEDEDEHQEGSFGRWYTELNAGPRLRLPGGVTAWIGTRFFLENLAGDIDGQERPTLRSMGVPGVTGALEVVLWDLLAVRAGANYDVIWLLSMVPVEDGTESDEVEGIYAGRQELVQRFRWSTGLGLTLDGFQLDATVAHNLYFDGPQFVGGGSPGFLGMLSAAYMW